MSMNNCIKISLLIFMLSCSWSLIDSGRKMKEGIYPKIGELSVKIDNLSLKIDKEHELITTMLMAVPEMRKKHK